MASKWERWDCNPGLSNTEALTLLTTLISQIDLLCLQPGWNPYSPKDVLFKNDSDLMMEISLGIASLPPPLAFLKFLPFSNNHS